MVKMEATQLALSSNAPSEREFIPIEWSAQYRSTFEAIIEGRGNVRSQADVDTAPIFLSYAAGELSAADAELTRVALGHLDKSASDTEVFITLLFAFFVAQRFDVVSALLIDRFGFQPPLEVGLLADGPGSARIVWSIAQNGTHRFEFDTTTFKSDKTRNDILSFQWTMPLYANYANSGTVETGSVIINQGDLGATPGLCYCDSRPDYFLIPDYIFLPTRGYAYFRSQALKKAVRWGDKAPVAMWRGATTGMRAAPNDWRSLERVRMCQALRNSAAPELFDVGLSSIIQFSNPAVVKEIEESGLKGDFIPADKWNSYKYLIDIDGNSSPWSNLFQKLLSGSTVLKVESYRGLQQWYYDSLKPWGNYVPISPDFGDMVDKVSWLRKHDSVAEAIGRAGRDLANHLSYERELARSVPVISAAFRYFRGDCRDVAPFGRVAADRVALAALEG